MSSKTTTVYSNQEELSDEISRQPAVGALHDTSRAGCHVSDCRGFLDTLVDAIQRAYPKVGNSRYNKVQVLLISWEDDDLNVEIEIKELQKVLWDFYQFPAEHWKIPSHDGPHGQLGDKVRDFQKLHDKEDSLLIVYYGGHGYLDKNRQLIWLW